MQRCPLAVSCGKQSGQMLPVMNALSESPLRPRATAVNRLAATPGLSPVFGRNASRPQCPRPVAKRPSSMRLAQSPVGITMVSPARLTTQPSHGKVVGPEFVVVDFCQMRLYPRSAGVLAGIRKVVRLRLPPKASARCSISDLCSG